MWPKYLKGLSRFLGIDLKLTPKLARIRKKNLFLDTKTWRNREILFQELYKKRVYLFGNS